MRKYRLDKNGNEQPVWETPENLRKMGRADARRAFAEGRALLRLSNRDYDDAAAAEMERLQTIANQLRSKGAKP